MLLHFINVLLQVLLHKSHDLLQEEITVAIYNMASVDFDAFYSAFMPEFLNGCQGVDTNQRAVLARNFKLERVTRLLENVTMDSALTSLKFIFFFKCKTLITLDQIHQLSNVLSLLQDLPSFTQSVQRLVNDLRYYRLCNSSLPTGTIKL